MKKSLRFFCISIAVLNATYSDAQCGAGYTSAQLNWDKLDYYYNSGSNVAPYGFSGGNYVTNAMEQTQKFAIGPNYVTISTSAAGIVKGENGSHTGDISGYTGDDAQFTPSSNGQTITLTFNTEVENLEFTLYDVDYSARLDFGAKNAASVAQVINLTKQSSSILTLNSNNTTSAYVTASNTSLGTSDNRGTVTVQVDGPVKQIVITVTTRGSDATFWLSDINACVTGTFPTNYNQTGENQPLQGPAGNQPDYFLITPDNDSVYMVDPATGVATALFGDPSNTYVNSMAYDPYNHILYYVSENYPAGSTNKKLKKYDFNTGAITTVFNDITTALNIPTFDQSLEGAGAAFYNGQLYLGVEGGKYSNSSPRESIVFRIDFDASLNPINICQVFATPSYNTSGTMLHDWADFIIKDGVLYNFNSQTGTTKVAYEHYDMMTGTSTKHMNPYSGTTYASQAGMDWAGNLYDFFGSNPGNGIALYNPSLGTHGAITPITNSAGIPWVGGAGDASENFRPQVDFGDAPASYDPNPASPASHATSANLKLGSNEDKEWVTRGQNLANDDNYDDALPYASIFNPAYGNYLIQASVYNNTGSNATVCAWLDYNGNGIFDASEGITVNVPSSASTQSIWLYWPSTPSSLSTGAYTYLRIRITSAANGMTTSNPTGYYNIGEVEDYRVPVNTYPLSVQTSDFTAKLTKANTTKLSWTSSDESDVAYYSIEKSTNNTDWSSVQFVSPQMKGGVNSYEINDGNLSEGITYYRLKTFQKNNKVTISTIKQVDNKVNQFSILVTPNPASSRAFVHINSNISEEATLELINSLGEVVYKQNMKINSGTNSIELPVVNLANGTYVVNLTTTTKSLRKTFIVNK